MILSTPTKILTLPTDKIPKFSLNVEINETNITIKTGIRRIDLNKYRLKFTKGNIDFKNDDDNFFSRLNFTAKRIIIIMVNNMKQNSPILTDVKMAGVFQNK